MMLGYPNFRHFYPSLYRPFGRNYINKPSDNSSNNVASLQNNKLSSSHTEVKMLNESNCNNKQKQNPIKDSDVFNIFGFSLHSDDILIVGLLIFLYLQEVNDPYLFMSLIFLLIN